MNEIEKGIVQTLIFYDIFEKPLTPLEIFKYLPLQNRQISFFEFKKALETSESLKKIKEERAGLFFLAGRSELLKIREKRIKESQLKLKKLKNISFILFFVPFLRMAALTGSLTIQNAKASSDLDLLAVARKNRLWTTRAFLIFFTQIFGVRRHGQKIKDRLCLNCFLTQDSLSIEKEAKPRDFFSAQEYGRLIPFLEKEPSIAAVFFKKNEWINEFLNFFPWPQNFLFKKRNSCFKEFPASFLEWGLAGKKGEWLEKKLGSWQNKRIEAKLSLSPEDQIFVSSRCLMFHPRSKGRKTMKEWREKEKIIIDQI